MSPWGAQIQTLKSRTLLVSILVKDALLQSNPHVMKSEFELVAVEKSLDVGRLR